MQTSPLGHVHFSELQPVLQSYRNISSNLGSTGGMSVVLGSSLKWDYSWICSPIFDSTISHTTGNALSTCTPSLAVTPFTKSYRDVLGANGFHCFRASSSLHVSFISRVLLVLPMSLYYSLNLNCTPVNVCWLRFTRKHAGIPRRQTSLWTSFISLPLISSIDSWHVSHENIYNGDICWQHTTVPGHFSLSHGAHFESCSRMLWREHNSG